MKTFSVSVTCETAQELREAIIFMADSIFLEPTKVNEMEIDESIEGLVADLYRIA